MGPHEYYPLSLPGASDDGTRQRNTNPQLQNPCAASPKGTHPTALDAHTLADASKTGTPATSPTGSLMTCSSQQGPRVPIPETPTPHCTKTQRSFLLTHVKPREDVSGEKQTSTLRRGIQTVCSENTEGTFLYPKKTSTAF